VLISEAGLIISGTYFGTHDEFEALNITSVFPDFSNSNVLVLNNFAGLVTNWAENVALTIGGIIPSAFYSKNLAFIKEMIIPDATVDHFFQYLDTVNKGTLIWFAIFDLEGGAINDIGSDATAYGHRDALFYMQTYAVGVFGISPTTKGFVTGMNDIMSAAFPGQTLGAYAGYVDPQLSNAQQAYFGSNLQRLEQFKSVIDPNDIFHNPQSIRPSS